MNNITIHPVILLGGSGTRLWPLSRSNYPKQFTVFSGEYSLFQETLLRLQTLPNVGRIYLMVSRHNYFICLDQLQALTIDNIELIVEPVARSTAPAITIAATHIQQTQDETHFMLVLPSDHHIKDAQKFNQTVIAAIDSAKNQLILFGIKPNSPAINYGYIEAAGDQLPASVKQFIEKPPIAHATELIKNKNMYWNSGMFCFSVKTFLQEMQRHQPDIIKLATLTLQNVIQQGNTFYADKKIFEKMPDISIDHALMEKTDRAWVYELQSDWSDLGDWKAIYDHAQKDECGNVAIGNVLSLSTTNAYLHSSKQLLTTIGLDNIIAVATKDSVLIANKDRAQDVKTLVELLKTSSYAERVKDDLKVYRPWGSYERLIHTPQFQVKHMIIKPGAKLSLQLHHRRSEHWVVVDGIADVVCGKSTFQMQANESTYIPKHTQHRLSNTQSMPLHLIEVQVGNYLGEDDIERFDDVYGQIDTLVDVH